MPILAHGGHGPAEMMANSFLHTFFTVEHLPLALSFVFGAMLFAAFAHKAYQSFNN